MKTPCCEMMNAHRDCKSYELHKWETKNGHKRCSLCHLNKEWADKHKENK